MNTDQPSAPTFQVGDLALWTLPGTPPRYVTVTETVGHEEWTHIVRDLEGHVSIARVGELHPVRVLDPDQPTANTDPRQGA